MKRRAPSRAVRAQGRYSRILRELDVEAKVAAAVERSKHGETIPADVAVSAIAVGMDPFEMARDTNEFARAS